MKSQIALLMSNVITILKEEISEPIHRKRYAYDTPTWMKKEKLPRLPASLKVRNKPSVNQFSEVARHILRKHRFFSPSSVPSTLLYGRSQLYFVLRNPIPEILSRNLVRIATFIVALRNHAPVLSSAFLCTPAWRIPRATPEGGRAAARERIFVSSPYRRNGRNKNVAAERRFPPTAARFVLESVAISSSRSHDGKDRERKRRTRCSFFSPRLAVLHKVFSPLHLGILLSLYSLALAVFAIDAAAICPAIRCRFRDVIAALKGPRYTNFVLEDTCFYRLSMKRREMADGYW